MERIAGAVRDTQKGGHSAVIWRNCDAKCVHAWLPCRFERNIRCQWWLYVWYLSVCETLKGRKSQANDTEHDEFIYRSYSLSSLIKSHGAHSLSHHRCAYSVLPQKTPARQCRSKIMVIQIYARWLYWSADRHKHTRSALGARDNFGSNQNRLRPNTKCAVWRCLLLDTGSDAFHSESNEWMNGRNGACRTDKGATAALQHIARPWMEMPSLVSRKCLRRRRRWWFFFLPSSMRYMKLMFTGDALWMAHTFVVAHFAG